MSRSKIQTYLQRLGNASPLVPGAIYTLVTFIGELATSLTPESDVAIVVTGALWLVGLALLWIVVTWYREDDWLAAGFLIGLSMLLGGLAAQMLAESLIDRSVGAAFLKIPFAPLRVLTTAIISVPACGAIVAGARWLTRKVRRARARER